VADTTVKRLLCCELRRTGKVMGQVFQCFWRICREINVFPWFEYHMFYAFYQFVTYFSDSLLYVMTEIRRILTKTRGNHKPV
jgi:hypothetical protein